MAICWFQMFPNDITCKIDIMCFHINIESYCVFMEQLFLSICGNFQFCVDDTR